MALPASGQKIGPQTKVGSGLTLTSGVLDASGGGSVSITATAPIIVTPSPITGTGDISHDVSGVSAGTYGDSTNVAQITVDATGHLTAVSNVAISGGGGGGDPPLVDISAGVPQVSTWTWLDQNGATATDSSPTGKAIFLQSAISDADRFNILYKAVPATPYIITAGFQIWPITVGAEYYIACFGFTDGTKLQLFNFGVRGDSDKEAVTVSNYNTTTSFNAHAFTPHFLGFVSIRMFQIADDGTNVSFSILPDGVNPVVLYSVAKASGFLGSGGYTNYCIGINQAGSNAIARSVTCRLITSAARSFP